MIDCQIIEAGTIPYADAFALQRREVERVQGGGVESLYLLEHPHVITMGRNASDGAIVADRRLVERHGVTIAETDRGGDVTYHGPGQLVGYPILHLEHGRQDIRRYVRDLEEVLIRTLADFGVKGARHGEHRGVWVGDRKIASLGIRISRWVTCHGFALNVNTDLSYFDLMHPCGIPGCRMTSIAEETGAPIDMPRVHELVCGHFAAVFGRNLITAHSRGEKARAHAG